MENTSSNSDKIFHHGYHRFYPRYLDALKDRPIRMLEIGIDREESMKLWSEYFPNAEIHGADIKKYASTDRITMHQLDQSNSNQLDQFASSFNEAFDFILDDGSHVPEHQILTLNHLWMCLKPGGIFIIEDVETNFWGKSSIYGYDFNSKKHNLFDYLKPVIFHINQEFHPQYRNDNQLFDEVESISFGHNCIILEKKRSSYSQFYSRKYRFSHLINFRSRRKRARKTLKLLFSGHPRAAYNAWVDPAP